MIEQLVFSPLGLTVALCLAFFVWVRRRALRAMWIPVVLCAAVLVAASVPIVPLGIIRLYTLPYRTAQASELHDIKAIVLLGAGTRTLQLGGEQISLLPQPGAARVLEAARVYRATRRAPWVVSSGGLRPQTPGVESSVAMRAALIALGVPAERIVLESKSLTTHDEAVIIAGLLRSLQAEPFALVTSRSHMPRALAAFRAQGLHPVPDVAPDVILPTTHLFMPDEQGWDLTRRLIHEWIGFAYYRYRGWTAAS